MPRQAAVIKHPKSRLFSAKYENFYGGMSTNYPPNVIAPNQFQLLMNAETKYKTLDRRKAFKAIYADSGNLPGTVQTFFSYRDSAGVWHLIAFVNETTGGVVYMNAYISSDPANCVWTLMPNKGGGGWGQNPNYLVSACYFNGNVFMANGYNGTAKWDGVVLDATSAPICSIVAGGPRRLMAIGLVGEPSWIQFSALDDALRWAGLEISGSNNVYQVTPDSELPDVGLYKFSVGAEDGQHINGYRMFRKTHVFGKDQSMWYGWGGLDPTGTIISEERFRCYRLSGKVGCVNDREMWENEQGELCWRGHDGQFYAWNGTVQGAAGTEQYGITIRCMSNPDDPREPNITNLMDFANGGYKRPDYFIGSVGADLKAEWENGNTNNANIDYNDDGTITLTKNDSGIVKREYYEPTGTDKNGYFYFSGAFGHSIAGMRVKATGTPGEVSIRSRFAIMMTDNEGVDTDFDWSIQPDDGSGYPNGTKLASGTFTYNHLATGGIQYVDIPDLVYFTTDSYYHIVLERTSSDLMHQIYWWGNGNNGYADGYMETKASPLDPWTTFPVDAWFEFFGAGLLYNTGGVWFGQYDKGDIISPWGLLTASDFVRPSDLPGINVWGNGGVMTTHVLVAGSGYHTGDVLTLVGGNNDAKITLTAAGGVVEGDYTLSAAGTGYTIGVYATTGSAYGSGATIIVQCVSDGAPDATHVGLILYVLTGSTGPGPTYADTNAAGNRIAPGTAIDPTAIYTVNRFISLLIKLEPERLGGIVQSGVTAGHAGASYAVGTTFSIATGDGNATAVVTGVNAGAVTTFTIINTGTNYATGTGIATSVLSGTGDGNLQVDITTISTRTHTPAVDYDKATFLKGSVATILSRACTYNQKSYISKVESTLVTPWNPNGTAELINGTLLVLDKFRAWSLIYGLKNPAASPAWPAHQTDLSFNDIVNHNQTMYIALAAALGGSILTISATPTAGGTGYTAGDLLNITTGGSGGVVRVAGVDANGVVTSLVLVYGGKSYSTGTGKATSGGTGINCTVSISTVSASAYYAQYDVDQAYDLVNDVDHQIWAWAMLKNDDYGLKAVPKKWHMCRIVAVGTGSATTPEICYAIDESGVFYPVGYDQGVWDLVNGVITSIATSPTAGGTGYTKGDMLVIAGGSGGRITVTSVSNGVVTAVKLEIGGKSYTTGAGKATTGGSGTGCTVNITAISTTYVTKQLNALTPKRYTLDQINTKWTSPSALWAKDWADPALPLLAVELITLPNYVDLDYGGACACQGYRLQPWIRFTGKCRIQSVEFIWEPLSKDFTTGDFSGASGGIAVEIPLPV